MLKKITITTLDYKFEKEKAHKNSANSPLILNLLVGVIACCLRLYFNFSQELIPGVNGGYYPLQVSSILTKGVLGFSDMPLLFYLDAFLIKLISLFGFPITDNLIMNVVKLTDSISIPMLLIPLYKISRTVNTNTSKLFEISVASFALLSLSPLMLVSDLQKNALGITFTFFFIAYLIAFQNNRTKNELLLSIIFLSCTGLTHFGTFIFALLFLVLIVGFEYRKRAIVPLLLLIFISLFIIAAFDITRFTRLFSVVSLIFERPAIINGMLAPPDFLIIFISIFLAIVGIIILKTKSSSLLLHQKSILFACISCLFIFSFPLLDGEYFKRLSLFLFIPQALMIIQIGSNINNRQIKILSVSLLIVTLFSMLAVFGRSKETILNQEAYEDLKKLHSIIKPDNQTIVIARHGLEWWTAWTLKTKVGQDKAMKEDFYAKYRNVFILHQINGLNNDRQRTPFREPNVPENSQMIYSSEYFKAFKVNSSQR